ncbi:MAG: DUF1461 domain-containing protein [Slackia sp.]|nr:DUF1461 domain-containing protein [Slackia sp.]
MKTLNVIARIVATVTLAIMLVSTGLFACCLRPTTMLLAQATSNDADSPYGKDALVGLALVTRDYTVDGTDRAATLDAIAQAAGDVKPDLAESDDKQAALEKLGERYTLTDDALDHLDDVYRVLVGTRWAFAGIGIVCIAALAHVLVRCGKRDLGGVLRNAAIAVIAAFAAMAAWVVVDFNGFFTVFHSLFFADGTWTFSWDSLLICMYPPEFWLGMGGVWLGITVAACAVCLIMGWLLRKRAS